MKLEAGTRIEYVDGNAIRGAPNSTKFAFILEVVAGDVRPLKLDNGEALIGDPGSFFEDCLRRVGMALFGEDGELCGYEKFQGERWHTVSKFSLVEGKCNVSSDSARMACMMKKAQEELQRELQHVYSKDGLFG